MIIEPENILEYTKEQLAEAFQRLDEVEEEWKAEKAVVAVRLQELMKDKEELIGDAVFTKVHRLTYKPDLEWARSVGAVKEEIDTPKTNSIIKSLVGNDPEVITKTETETNKKGVEKTIQKKTVKVGQQEIEVSESNFVTFKRV